MSSVTLPVHCTSTFREELVSYLVRKQIVLLINYPVLLFNTFFFYIFHLSVGVKKHHVCDAITPLETKLGGVFISMKAVNTFLMICEEKTNSENFLKNKTNTVCLVV